MSLTSDGFYRPDFNEIVSNMEQLAKEQLGEDIDTTETSVLGKFLRIVSYSIAEEYETLENVYYARFPNTANGVSLDRLVVSAGITRNPATYSRHNITVYGTADTEVGMGGLLVSTDDNITFYNENDFTIGSDGKVNVIVSATEAGASGNVDSITKIVNPVTGISSIAYIGLEEIGEDTESDIDLRKRYSIAVSGAGSCNIDALIGAIYRISGIDNVNIVENNNSTTDSDGRPGTSFEVYIYGGDGVEQEIADTIFIKKPFGIKAVSTADTTHKITKIVKDTSGEEHTIYYSKVTEVTLDISVTIKTDVNYTTDGATAIKNNLVKYIKSIGVGGSVVTSAMYRYIFDVSGVTEIVSVTQAKIGQIQSTDTIKCNQNEVPITTATNITVTVDNE